MDVKITDQFIEDCKLANLLYRAITNKFKLKILLLLTKNDGATVSEICSVLALSQPMVSLYLAGLRKYHLVIKGSATKRNVYMVNKNIIEHIIKITTELMQVYEPGEIDVKILLRGTVFNK